MERAETGDGDHLPVLGRLHPPCWTTTASHGPPCADSEGRSDIFELAVREKLEDDLLAITFH